MNIDTGREFPFTNPQDDPECYQPPPSGFDYDYNGRLIARPIYDMSKKNDNRGYYETNIDDCIRLKKEIENNIEKYMTMYKELNDTFAKNIEELNKNF